MKYEVRRGVQCDRWYDVGEIMDAKAHEVGHLVKSGVLVPVEGGEKAAPKPRNKAAPKPRNKAQ